MSKLHFSLIFLLITFNLTAKQDSLFTKIIGDTVQIWNINVEANCVSEFDYQILFVSSYTIAVTECDTVGPLANCICNFDVHVSLMGLNTGQYTVSVYRQELKKYFYPKDTTKLIGELTFYLENSSVQTMSSYFHQSECHPFVDEQTFTARYWYPEAVSSAKAMHDEVELRSVYSDDVLLDGKSTTWNYKFSWYDQPNDRLEYLYFHNDPNGVVFDSVSLTSVCCVMYITDEWFDSDSAIAYVEAEGGKIFRQQNPDYVISASLYQALVPYSYPCWSVTYLSKIDNTKKFSLYFDARKNSSPLISFSPEVDTLFLLGGCTTPELSFHSGSIGAADNISLEPGFNTSVMTRDSLDSYIQADNSYFLVVRSTGNYDYEIWYYPKSYPPFDPVLIPFDSTFYFGQRDFDIQLKVKLNGKPIDSLTQSFIADFGLGVESGDPLPKEYTLLQNYPNPFNPATTIKYELPKESKVQLIIYNILGKKVAELVNSFQKAGMYEVIWNAENFASSVYIYQIKANGFISSKKLILLK